MMGLEVEIPGITRAAAEAARDFGRMDIHNDGSLRIPTYAIKESGQCVLPMKNKAASFIIPSGCAPIDMGGRGGFGAEIVTSPYPYRDMLGIAKKIGEYFGHIPTHPRASIHVHVDVGNRPWRYVQNVIRWFVHLEAPLYRIAAFNERHRGELAFEGEANNHRYARPITNSIYMYNRDKNDELVASINVADLLEAKTASSMLKAWGRMDRLWRGADSKYIPHRLHGLNITPIQYQGTLEWRIFNGSYRHTALIIELVNAIHEIALKSTPDFKPMYLGGKYEFSAKDFYNIVGVDVSHVWGKKWGNPCTPQVGHYNQRNENYFRLSERVFTVTNNNGSDDNSKDDFVLYRRRG